MYKVCKTEGSVQRQRQFQKALLELLKKQDYRSVTITALCREAGIPRNAFYRYFESIEDVLHAQIDSMLLDSALFLWGNFNVKGYFSYWKEKKSFLDILEQQVLSSNLTIRAYVLQAKEDNGLNMSVQHVRNYCYLTSFMTILIMWHHSGMKQSVEEMEHAFWQVFHSEG